MFNYNMSASLRFNVFTPLDYVQHVCIVCGIFVLKYYVGESVAVGFMFVHTVNEPFMGQLENGAITREMTVTLYEGVVHAKINFNLSAMSL